MSEAIFWGENGEYGPFTVQKDGWPNAGEVIRHYRKKCKMSAEDLAQQYSKGTGERVTARWILKMEQQNKIPVDIIRRRILIKILNIPPTLLGLSSLSQVSYALAVETTQRSSTLRRNISTMEVAKYDQQARDRWLLSYTGKEDAEEIIATINVLEMIERQSSGEALKYVREVLNSHYQLASDITRHQGDFAAAYSYANNAVRVTKLVGIQDFTAAALYRRGYTNLERAIFGDNVLLGKINHEPDRKKIEQAIIDFEEALLHARPQLKGAIWLELSRAQGIVQNMPSSLRLLSQAENKVGSGSTLVDNVEQILLEGALNGLSEGMYLLGKAASLIVLEPVWESKEGHNLID